MAAVVVTYKDFKLVSPTPTGDGGIALNENFILTADQLEAYANHASATTSVHGATSANTANRIVARDANGDFTAGTITATSFVGPLTGNASTATTATTSSDAQSHIALTNNPHSTTAAQVGAYTTAATDTLLSAKLNVSSVTADSSGVAVGRGTGVETIYGYGWGVSAGTPQVTVMRIPAAESHVPPHFVNYVDADINATASGTIDSATGTSFTDSIRTEATHYWVGYYVTTTGGTGTGQNRRITASTSSGVFTITPAWTTTPDATTTYTIQRHDHILQIGHNADRSSNYDISDHSWYLQQESFFKFGTPNYVEAFHQYTPPGGTATYRPWFVGFDIATLSAQWSFRCASFSLQSDGSTVTAVERTKWTPDEGFIVHPNVAAYVTGTASAGSTTTLTDIALANRTDLIGRYIEITSGTGSSNLARAILDVSALGVVTVSNFQTAPNATSVYRIFTCGKLDVAKNNTPILMGRTGAGNTMRIVQIDPSNNVHFCPDGNFAYFLGNGRFGGTLLVEGLFSSPSGATLNGTLTKNLCREISTPTVVTGTGTQTALGNTEVVYFNPPDALCVQPLPASPTTGLAYKFINISAFAATIGRNTRNINGAAADLTLNAGKAVTLRYSVTGTSWWTEAAT